MLKFSKFVIFLLSSLSKGNNGRGLGQCQKSHRPWMQLCKATRYKNSECNGGLNSLYLDETKCTYKIKCGQISGKQGFVKIASIYIQNVKFTAHGGVTKNQSSPPLYSRTPGFGKIMIHEGLERLSTLYACQSQHYERLQ